MGYQLQQANLRTLFALPRIRSLKITFSQRYDRILLVNNPTILSAKTLVNAEHLTSLELRFDMS